MSENETPQPAEGVLAVENTNLKLEVERLKDANADLSKKLEESATAITLRAEKVEELVGKMDVLREELAAAQSELDKAKAGTLTASELTVEALLTSAYDKLLKFDDTLPCVENKEAIRRVKDAKDWLLRRTSLRKMQNVEGTLKPHRSQI